MGELEREREGEKRRRTLREVRGERGRVMETRSKPRNAQVCMTVSLIAWKQVSATARSLGIGITLCR